MAKLLKHLGFGGKKAPPQPPKPDYSGLKSGSTEYPLARSPTNERSTPSVGTGTAHIGEAEGGQLQGSPHRTAAGSAEKGNTSHGGARPKETGGGGVSPKGASVDRVSMPSVSSIDDPEGPATGEQERQDGAVGPGPSATPPRLLDEYSDPLDLKKQILEESMLGVYAGPIAEDDYSVPYEVKKLFKEMGLREGMDQISHGRMRGRNPRLYDDPYDEAGVGAIVPSGGPPGPAETGDRRPKEDYDEPWEWSVKQSLILKTELAGGHNLPPHFMTKQTPQTNTPLFKRTVEAKPAAAAAAENEEPEEEEDGEPDFIETVDTELEQPVEGEKEAAEVSEEIKLQPSEEKTEEKVEAEKTESKEEGTKDKEKEQEKEKEKDKDKDKEEAEGAVGGSEEPDVQVVEEDYGYEVSEMTSSYEKTKRHESDEENEHEGYTHLTGSEAEGESTLGEVSSVTAEEPTPASSSTSTAVTGNYEEPWDLSLKQREIADKLKAVSDRASRDLNAKSKGPPPHESDTRSQEGYEKPWDWKPHQKDDRSQEGYEKPWDWKPHQKDDRPVEEYEEPWDQKAKGLCRDLLSPKSSNPPSGPGSKTDPRKEEDTRPPEEYDEPWENKMKKSSSSPKAGSSSDSSPKSSQSPGTGSPHHSASSPHHGPSTGLSPKKKQHKLNLDLGNRSWNMVGERIDPTVPLDQQGWYHGSISRVDAENLLRVHKEGSYLVRMSESSKMDFSLSLKSARGFMHMKIVHRDNKFILGQFSQPFATIPEMIHHYSRSKLPIKGAEHMSLLHPVINELL